MQVKDAATATAAVGMQDNEAIFMSFLPYVVDTNEKEDWKNIKVGDTYDDIIQKTQDRIKEGDSWRELVAGISEGSPTGDALTSAIGEKTGLPQMNDDYMYNFLDQWKGNENLKGFEVVGIESHDGQDPYAIVFKKDDTLLVAYRGTENRMEWADDAMMALNAKDSYAIQDAVGVIDKYHEMYPECQIWTDGHSRGGSESMIAAIERPDVVDKCWSVEGMSMPQSYINERADNITKASPNMVSLNAENDFCNQFGHNPCGTIKYFECNDGVALSESNFLAGHIPLNMFKEDGVTLNKQVEGPTEAAKGFHDFAASVEEKNPEFYQFATKMFCAAIPVVQGDYDWKTMIGQMGQTVGEYGKNLINDFSDKAKEFIADTKENIGNFVNGFADKFKGMEIAEFSLGKILSDNFRENIFAPAFNEFSMEHGMGITFGSNHIAEMANPMGIIGDQEHSMAFNPMALVSGEDRFADLNMDALKDLAGDINLGALKDLGKESLNLDALKDFKPDLDVSVLDTFKDGLDIGRTLE